MLCRLERRPISTVDLATSTNGVTCEFTGAAIGLCEQPWTNCDGDPGTPEWDPPEIPGCDAGLDLSHADATGPSVRVRVAPGIDAVEGMRLALVEFVRRHRFELMEQFQRDDIAWALTQKESPA